MINDRATFLHFLADNLTGLTVVNLRQDPVNQESSRIHNEAVNVQFLRDDLSVQIGGFLVAIDCVSSSELTAVAMSRQVWQLLSAAAYTPQLDYTDPLTPVTLGSNLYWDQNRISFKPVSDIQFRYSCLLHVRYHAY